MVCSIVLLFSVSTAVYAQVTEQKAFEDEPAVAYEYEDQEEPISSETDGKKFYTLAGTGTQEDGVLSVPQIRVVTADGNGTTLQKEDGYVNASITITDTDGSVLADACSFKVRGNTTAMAGVKKKAYTFKFGKKKEVLGLGKGKKWALLAYAFDPTMLRNTMAFELANELGLSYTSGHRFVEVYVDDSYRGCYELCEPVQEGKDRVNIDIESNGGKKDFLVEFEANRVEDDTTYFTAEGLRFIASDPDEPDEEQLEYITGTMTGIIQTMKTGSKEGIEAAIDVPSFAAFYLLNEYYKTMDFDSTSVFFYYQNGKLYAGPVWDFDMSTGNTNATINSTRAKNTAATDGILQSKRNLYQYLCNKSWFMDEVKKVYENHYDYITGVFTDGGLLDTWSQENMDMFTRNASVWTWSRQWYNYQMKPLPTYAENLSYLKNWLNERNTWLYNEWDLFSYEYIRGDTDGNGCVDVLDVTMIQRALAGLSVQDNDGHMALRAAVKGTELSIVDATILLRYLAGMGNPYELDTVVKVKLQ